MTSGEHELNIVADKVKNGIITELSVFENEIKRIANLVELECKPLEQAGQGGYVGYLKNKFEELKNLTLQSKPTKANPEIELVSKAENFS